jgi:hypothetical protein
MQEAGYRRVDNDSFHAVLSFPLGASFASEATLVENEVKQLVRIIIHGPKFCDLSQVGNGSNSLLLGKLRE